MIATFGCWGPFGVHMRSHLLVAAVVGLLAGGGEASAQADMTLARLTAPTDVREYDGQALISVYDRATDRYHLTLVERGGRLRPLPVIVDQVPFDADIGPGPDGAPTIVYARDGNLWRLRVGARRPYRLLSASVGLSHPTIWGRRLAYVSGANRVLVRGVRWPTTRPSVARPGVPRWACDGRCRTASGSIDELALQGHSLALLVGFGADDLDDGGQQVRVDDTVTGATRTIEEIGNGGLSGYVIGAISFADQWLGWRGLCTADPGGCSGSSQIYRMRGRREQKAIGHYVPAVGFALTRRGSLQVVARGEFGLSDPAEGCRGPVSATCSLIQTEPLRWRSVSTDS